MTPIVFKGRFGWLHAGRGSHGVVLCQPYGHESAWAHKALRYLAEELTRFDIPVLRFDYLATGDSADGALEGDQLDGMAADVGAAIDYLRASTGVTKVTLCGLRLGATLAALASHHPLVDSLALLAPVINGRRYLRELTAVRQTWLGNLPAPVRAVQTGSPFHVLGQAYGEALLDRLNKFDLASALSRQTALPKRIFLSDALPQGVQSLAAKLRERDVETQCDAFDDYLEFMQETAQSVLPEKTLSRVALWIANSAKEATPGKVKITRPGIADDALIETPEAVERPVVFGDAGIFGILCEPRGGMPGGPVIVIANTAGTVHHGDSRLSVRIARKMAARGVATLRIDARGIGDSPARMADGSFERIACIHAQTTIEDVASAAAWLKRKGYSTVVTFGICSGAYSALRASLIEPAISAVIAVNVQRFYVDENVTLKELQNRINHSMSRLGPALFKPDKWWQVLSGKRGFKPIFKAFSSHAVARIHSCLTHMTGTTAFFSGDNALLHPHGVVKALERKGVRTFLLFGGEDEGLDQLNGHFGKHGKRLSKARGMTVEIHDDIDHAVYDPYAVEHVIALAESFIRAQPVRTAPVEETIPGPVFHGSPERGSTML
ncbi:serine aminopeptidase domain-containing protein [Caballeronia sp. BR00000012568055]|uniref:alpha/beta hydrolase n=1 Tax=Caballeronia sp. BR00000012568055 TaxID=2918761 RepID=UPI0023F865DC|nr:alpha/beta hydrolase [Caballeronia sp. BR00000012568055]